MRFLRILAGWIRAAYWVDVTSTPPFYMHPPGAVCPRCDLPAKLHDAKGCPQDER